MNKELPSVFLLLILFFSACVPKSHPKTISEITPAKYVNQVDEQKTEQTNDHPIDCLPEYGKLEEFLHISTSANTWWIDSADFNGDGYPDILVSRGSFQTGEPHELEILLNDKKGSFSVETENIFSGSIPKLMEPREIVLADFNNDEIPDIFVADQGYDRNPWPGYQNTLILSTRDGKLIDATSNLPQQSDQTHSATTADIDGDGDYDLFIGNLGGGGVSPQIWLNNGNGEFAIANNILPSNHTDLSKNWYTTAEFADINNDNFPDLIMGQGDPDRDSHILLNDGSGKFSEVETPLPRSFFAPNQNVVDISPGDINNDGFLDLLVVDTDGPTYNGWHIQVLINNHGDGTFSDETDIRLEDSYSANGWMFWADLIDINMDGFLDIAASPAQGSGNPLFFINDGSGNYSMQSNVFRIDHSYLWTFLDINQDGYKDAYWAYPPGGGTPEIHFMVMALGCR